MNELNGLYLKEFKSIRKVIIKKTKESIKQTEVLEDIYLMFLDAQNKRMVVGDVIYNKNDFLNDIITSLPKRKLYHFRKKTLNMYRKVFNILCLFLIIVFSYGKIERPKQFVNLNPPIIRIDEVIPNRIVWDEINHVEEYEVYIDGKFSATVSEKYYDIGLKNYGYTAMIQVKALSINDAYSDSVSKIFYYTVPNNVYTRVDCTKGHNVNGNSAPINLFGESFYLLKVIESGYYRLSFQYPSSTEVDNFNISYLDSMINKTSTVVEELFNNEKVYYLDKNNEYNIKLLNLDKTHLHINMLISPLSFDVVSPLEFIYKKNKTYLFKLENLNEGVYNFINELDNNIYAHILDKNYQNFRRAHYGLVEIFDSTEIYYLKVMLKTNVSEANIRLINQNPSVININEKIQLNENEKVKAFIFYPTDFVFDYNLLKYYGNAIFYHNVLNENFNFPAGYQASGDPGITRFILDGRVKKVFIYITYEGIVNNDEKPSFIEVQYYQGA